MTDFYSHLILSIRNGENETARSIIERCHLYNSVDTTQATLLHYAAKSGNENITRYLLNKGCYVDPQDAAGKTPLIMAMRRNCVGTIRILLQAGASVSALNKKNKSALHYFAAQHDFSIAAWKLVLLKLQEECSTRREIKKKIIEAGCILCQAACLGNTTVIEYMLNRGFPIDSIHPTSKQTALHSAVSLEDTEMVKLLLHSGADVNAIDNHGANPLFYIYKCSRKHTREKTEILQMLLDSGVVSTSSTSGGFFQITHVLSAGNVEAIRAVLQSNIDIASRDVKARRTILYNLATNSNPGVTEELQRHIKKFDVNVVDSLGITPLFFAVVRGNVKMVEFLLKQGADPNCTQLNKGFTPLYYALTVSRLNFESQEEYLYRSDQCVELLLQYKANSQILINKADGVITLFDAASSSNYLYRMKPVVAHLAMLEALGTTSLNEKVSANINSDQNFKDYFDECKQILGKKVFGSVTVLKLLHSDQKKLIPYFNKEKFVIKLDRLRYKLRAMTTHPYYYNTLRKRLSKGLYNKRFRNKASEVVCKILQGVVDQKQQFVVDKKHFVIDRIIDYLNHEDLCHLYEF